MKDSLRNKMAHMAKLLDQAIDAGNSREASVNAGLEALNYFEKGLNELGLELSQARLLIERALSFPPPNDWGIAKHAWAEMRRWLDKQPAPTSKLTEDDVNALMHEQRAGR